MCDNMAIHQYFSRDSRLKNSILPNPTGPLCSQIKPRAITMVNKEVKQLMNNEKANKTRGQYNVYTEEEKLKVGKRAAETGVIRTIRYFEKEFPDCPLKENTVRT